MHAHGGGFEPKAGDLLTRRAFPLFFDVLRVLLEAEVTVVAEAAFQDPLWRRGLEPLTKLGHIRIVRCEVDAATAYQRYCARGEREAHASIIGSGLDDWTKAYESFAHLSLEAPSIAVDTADGYTPSIADIVAFVNRGESTG